MEDTNKQFTVVLVTSSWNGKTKLTVKGRSASREEGEVIKTACLSKCFGDNTPDYRVLGPIQLKRLEAQVRGHAEKRRAEGAKRAAATRAKRGTKPTFVCCPTCGAKSKKLYSEFGGLQTRKCANGHTFEYDKWLADRAFWGPIVGSGPVPESAIKRPVEV